MCTNIKGVLFKQTPPAITLMTLAVATLLPNIFDIDCRAPHVLRTIIVVFRRRALIAFLA